ncbi:MAG: hypothetical protein QOE82_3001 [Thermoanaerobaculia bacterium]|nr:hypothetical protein [Thermoanaerobaculia bacterium]
MNNAIQSLWIGPALSTMERLSLTSFVAAGHDVHLYTYDDVDGVPEGVELWDAAEILPRERIFRYAEHETVAGFSNFFRYKLLLDRGGWWVDTDVVCLKRFDFACEHVFASEIAKDAPVVTSCVIRAPAGSPAMRMAWEVCDASDSNTLRWGETGPKLCGTVVRELKLDDCVQPPSVFCPIPYHRWRDVLDPEVRPDIRRSHAVHLWNELWRRGGASKDGPYESRCLYALLLRLFGLA